MTKPAHFELVDRVFEQREAWARIEARLHRHLTIARHFPLAMLREHQGRGPYGVHYMAWRLGVWETEQRFEVLEELIDHAAALPGWAGEASLMTSAEFGQYWGLVWQLQVARFLSERCSEVQWLGGNGPDLRATTGGREVHVECYSYQKRFGPVEFVRDVLSRVDPAIRVEHNLCVPIAYAGTTSAFLDDFLRPFLDGSLLAQAKERAATRWPVDLPLPEGTSNLRVSVEGEDMGAFWPMSAWGTSGPPERYLEVAMREVTAAKAGKNRLDESANNVVAINVLSTDFQSSLDRQIELGLTIPEPRLPSDIQMATVSTCGIDAPRATFRLGFTSRIDHPGLQLFQMQ